MSEELKPCPFCGGDVGITHIYDGEEVISCHGCWTGMRDDTPERLAAKWNTRADHIPDASKMMWISVDDRLPDEDDGVVVVCVNNVAQFVDVDCFEDGNWQSYMYGSITHWMPLPEPPNV